MQPRPQAPLCGQLDTRALSLPELYQKNLWFPCSYFCTCEDKCQTRLLTSGEDTPPRLPTRPEAPFGTSHGVDVRAPLRPRQRAALPACPPSCAAQPLGSAVYAVVPSEWASACSEEQARCLQEDLPLTHLCMTDGRRHSSHERKGYCHHGAR